VIAKGVIETSEAPRSGVTVANFRVSDCYRGPFKPGDVISYTSFREGDRYSSEYLCRAGRNGKNVCEETRSGSHAVRIER
jgi:hypothetical protein